MDDMLQLASLVAALVATGPAPDAGSTLPAHAITLSTSPAHAIALPTSPVHITALPTPATLVGPGEDKFRHAAASWAVTVFAYSAARAAQRDGDDALVVALPITAAFGIGKEIADYRRGGDFSVGDLVADAIGAGVAWLVLREVR